MDNQVTPVLRYGRTYAVDEVVEPKAGARPPISKLNEAFTRAALAVCLVGWTFVGFFLWIPRMLRGVVVFSIALVQSTLTETSAESAGRDLRSAANFYRRGFVGAVDAIRPRAEATQDDARSEARSGVDGRLIIRETAWAIVVWYVMLWPLGVFTGTPADVAALPWSDYGASIARAIASFAELFR